MKTRSGFVSNSSSSSFVIISTLQAHKKAKSQMSFWQSEMIERAVAIKHLGDEDVAILSILRFDGGITTDGTYEGELSKNSQDVFDEPEGKRSFGTAVEAYYEYISKDSDTVRIDF